MQAQVARATVGLRPTGRFVEQRSSEDLSKQGFNTRVQKPPAKGVSFVPTAIFSSMSWRIIYIEESDYLSLYLDNIRIKRPDREVTIPLSDINTLMIDNSQATLSVNLINKCAELNVNIITCNQKHLPEAILLPVSGHYRAAALLRTQMDWSEEFRGHLWQRVVQTKILRQASVLSQAQKSRTVCERMYRFAAETQQLDAGNCEGLAAKMYFRELFGETFLRDEENIVNAGLNYGYSILRSQIARSVVAHGLNPHIGIFHRGPNNAFNLCDDIIEPFRPIIDYFVYDTLVSQKSLPENIGLR